MLAKEQVGSGFYLQDRELTLCASCHSTCSVCHLRLPIPPVYSLVTDKRLEVNKCQAKNVKIPVSLPFGEEIAGF